MSAGEIDIPGGVITLRFGGVDVDYTAPGGTPLNQTGQSNEFEINLGLPLVTGHQHHRQHRQHATPRRIRPRARPPSRTW